MELAVLLIDTEDSQEKSAKLDRDAARQSSLTDARHQVDALREAASDIANGALAGAALTIGGGLCEGVSAGYKFDADTSSCRTETASLREASSNWGAFGNVSDRLAPQATTLLGTAPAEHDKATAKQFETAAEQARWQAGDASTAIDKAEKQSDKVISLLQSIQGDQNSATNAIIGRI